jgi:hypothetical protein
MAVDHLRILLVQTEVEGREGRDRPGYADTAVRLELDRREDIPHVGRSRVEVRAEALGEAHAPEVEARVEGDALGPAED